VMIHFFDAATAGQQISIPCYHTPQLESLSFTISIFLLEIEMSNNSVTI
jgi:hypothetical protein